MGYNLQSCCHICKVQIFHFRNEENKTIRQFYIKHIPCIKINDKAVETIIDQVQEPKWTETYLSVTDIP